MNRGSIRECQPLFGLRVLITRSRSQAGALADLLREQGAEPVFFATIEIREPEDWGLLDEAVARIEQYDWIVFTSTNGVDFFCRRLMALGRDLRALSRIKRAAIGAATAARLSAYSLCPDYQPQVYLSQAVVEGLQSAYELAGKRILLPRADIASPELAQGLREAGAEVTSVVAYRTVRPEVPEDKIDALLNKGIDVVIFTSASTVRNLVAILGPSRLRQLLQNARVACIGPVTRQTAAQLGITTHIMPADHTIPALVEALIQDR